VLGPRNTWAGPGPRKLLGYLFSWRLFQNLVFNYWFFELRFQKPVSKMPDSAYWFSNQILRTDFQKGDFSRLISGR
jgi:hypothetical protein